jgi:hypothetical protein
VSPLIGQNLMVRCGSLFTTEQINSLSLRSESISSFCERHPTSSRGELRVLKVR